MSLQREVMYLEPQHVTKLDEVQQKFGLGSHSEATRFLLDSVEPDNLENAAELAMWVKLIDETVAEAKASVGRAEISLDRALAYFAEKRTERPKREFTGNG